VGHDLKTRGQQPDKFVRVPLFIELRNLQPESFVRVVLIVEHLGRDPISGSHQKEAEHGRREYHALLDSVGALAGAEECGVHFLGGVVAGVETAFVEQVLVPPEALQEVELEVALGRQIEAAGGEASQQPLQHAQLAQAADRLQEVPDLSLRERRQVAGLAVGVVFKGDRKVVPVAADGLTAAMLPAGPLLSPPPVQPHQVLVSRLSQKLVQLQFLLSELSFQHLHHEIVWGQIVLEN
jgi:hypothetical protein